MRSPPLPSASALVAVVGLTALAAALVPVAPATAGDLVFSADTGEAEASGSHTAWPDRVIVDATTWTLLAIWTADPPRELVIPMATITRFERARPWEGRPDELAAVLKDGSRVLVARGDGVTTAATLLTAVVGRQVAEVDPAGDWPAATREDDKTPDTTMALGSVHTGSQVATALGDSSAAAGSAAAGTTQERRAQLYDAEEALPSNADTGALGSAEIQVAIKQRMSGIRQCYNRELKRHGALSGKVVVWFLIDTDGSVSRARLKESTMGNIVVEDCIVDEVAAMTFPKPQGDKVVPVSFPFSFTDR